MKLKMVLAAFTLLAAALSGRSAVAQANVLEQEPLTVYVNSASGSDANDASSARPLQTIQSALNIAAAKNAAGIGVKVLLAPGVYREAITVGPSRTSAATTIEATTAGTAVVDGAVVLKTFYSAGNGTYNFPWTDSVDGCSLPSGWYTGMPPVVLANEMLFVNGAVLTQVMAASQLRAGTFFVNKSSKELQVYPPANTNINSATVEVSAKRSVLTVNGGSNLVFRGMVFQHAAACINDSGATVNSASNVLFDSDVMQWNNWSGLGFNNTKNVTVENSIASFNGGAGITGSKNLNINFENNETDYDNWRGAMVGLYDFSQGGIKMLHAHGATVSGHLSYNNPSQGLWFDTDNIDVSIKSVKLVGNLVGNLQLELNQGPITVENSSFCNGSGVQILESDGITMTGNHFYNNGGTTFQNGQFFLAGKPGGREVTNWQTGKSVNLISKNITFSDNTFTAVGSNQYVFNTYLSGSDWSAFTSTFRSSSNEWYNSSRTSDFQIEDGKVVNLAGWRSATGQDSNSTFQLSSNASEGCSAPTPSYPDFQVLAHNAASYVASYSMSNGEVSIPVGVRSFKYGTVTLSAAGLPSNVTASFSTPSLTSGNSTLTLRASKSAKSAQVPITITAVSGSRVHTITVQVNVRPA